MRRVAASMLLILALSLPAAGCGGATGQSSQQAGGEATQPGAAPAQPPSQEQQASEQGEKVAVQLTDESIKLATDAIEKYDVVQDAAVSVDHDQRQVSAAIIVAPATNEETAKEMGENYVRLLATFAGGKSPTKDYLGELWEEYNLIVTVADPGQNIIARGTKVRTSPQIRW